jgi:hypothetical protein
MPAGVAAATRQATRLAGECPDLHQIGQESLDGEERGGRWSCCEVATARGGLPPRACGESRGRRKQVRHGGLARRRGERASSWTTHLGVSMLTIVQRLYHTHRIAHGVGLDLEVPH